MSFVLLDIGGTYIKCRLSDSSLTYKVKFPSFIQNSSKNIKEIKSEELISEINLILSKVINSENKIQGILISGQMHGWIITDINYSPLTNIVSWQDTRGLILDNFYINLMNQINKIDHDRCGNEIKAGSPLVGISYVLKEIQTTKYKVFSLLSWVAYLLASNYKYEINCTDAASFSFLNLNTNDWNDEISRITNININMLPAVTRNIEIIGYSKQFKCPIYTPVGDFQASLFGCQLERDEISINIATGGQVSMITDLSEDMFFQKRPYFENQWIATKTHLPAGRHANYILSKFNEGNLDQNWKLLDSFDSNDISTAMKSTLNNIDIHQIYLSDKLQSFNDTQKLIILFSFIIEEYLQVVEKFQAKNYKRIVGSGGLISNSKFVRDLIEYKGQFKFDKIILNQDASLKGLELLSKMI